MSINVIQTDLDFSPLEQAMQAYVDKGILSCVNSLILKGTDVVHYKTYGYMDNESRTPLREDAIYRMYSNTKIVTSVAAMMLFEEGRFGLDDPVGRFIPALADLKVLKSDATSADDVEPAQSPITMRQILSHSAGLSYGFIEPGSVIDQAYAKAGMLLFGGYDPTLEELCDTLGTVPLAYQPGTSWRYSLGTDVTARVIEVISGQTFDDFLQSRIFAPLGMVDTGFAVPEHKRDRFVTMYAPVDLFDPMKPGMNKADDPQTGQYTKARRFLSGGGGLVSTVSDYVRFLQMIINGGEWQGQRLLSEKSLQLMRTNQLAAGVSVRFPMWDMPGTVFGLGFALKETLEQTDPAGAQDEYHWGGMAGTHTWMAPHSDIAGVCMTQRMPGFWHPFSHEFKALTYQIAG